MRLCHTRDEICCNVYTKGRKKIQVNIRNSLKLCQSLHRLILLHLCLLEILFRFGHILIKELSAPVLTECKNILATEKIIKGKKETNIIKAK